MISEKYTTIDIETRKKNSKMTTQRQHHVAKPAYVKIFNSI